MRLELQHEKFMGNYIHHHRFYNSFWHPSGKTTVVAVELGLQNLLFCSMVDKYNKLCIFSWHLFFLKGFVLSHGSSGVISAVTFPEGESTFFGSIRSALYGVIGLNTWWVFTSSAGRRR
jgi:hypothetical protein